MRVRAATVAAAWLMSGFAAGVHAGDGTPSWKQWGGPGQDFLAPAGDLAESWPEEGPATLWQRELGDGQSAILFENDRLYTMYREEGREVVVALEADGGDLVWEHRYEAPYDGRGGYGTGPRATPLLAGNRIFTVGVGGILSALDKRDGSLLWRKDLWGEGFGGNHLSHGYSSSPIAWGELVIVPVGGEGAGLVAFDQASGERVWSGPDVRNSFSSPKLVELLGEEQLLVFMAREIVGLSPATGELLWSYPQTNQWNHNITLPTIVDDDIVVISSPQAGARGLRLSRSAEGIEVEQIWAARRIQFYHAATVRDGDWIYGSTGTVAPAFMAALNVRTGEIGWRTRGFAKANCVGVDGRLLILDEDGKLYLASVTPEGIEVHSSTQLLDRVAWTVPTVIGNTMYVRDQERILAIDLG